MRRIPKGPAGQYNLPGPFTDMLMGYSKNQKAAKDFLRWIHSKPIYDQWFVSQQGYTCGATKEWEKHAVWDVDPVLKPFKDLPSFGRLAGYAGPPNRKAAEVDQQVHHRRHVRQGDPGHAGRGSGQVGTRRRRPRRTCELLMQATRYRPADDQIEGHSRPIAR